MLRNLKLTVLVLLWFILSVWPVKAENAANGYLFYGLGCPHCAREKVFLDIMKEKYPEFQVKEFEVYYNRENARLFERVAKNLGEESNGVPFLVIGEKSFVGFGEGVTDRAIEAKIVDCIEKGCGDKVAQIIQGENKTQSDPPAPSQEVKSEADAMKSVELPILGVKELSALSLPILTIVLAALDGFNPCAMWTLLFLISLLLGMKSRRRMWILGLSFIAASAGVYFLFLSAWLNLFMFLGYVVWIRAIIGAVAVAAGVYYLRDFYINRNGACQVMNNEKRQKTFARLAEITKKQSLSVAVLGIVLLAVAVNMVELVCSAGLPAVYTQILSLSPLAKWQYYAYLLVYVLIFMLDDMLVFAAAMWTLKNTGLESKYSRYSHLIGGVLILVIGILLIFKPEALMFGA